ncbi:hypothetical protein [uncultured Roseobacter sp.]|uniref:hypothetical protein n=1 Tax=uncultured Roseobacter sp. TaxID=114847 RepID=UPI00260E88CC|nr:hypothetical protein [uncultured Roseobacter sp.]
MSEPSKLPSKAVFNLLCLKACIGFGGSWLFWQMAVPGFEMFLYIAGCWALGGAICTVKALWQLSRIIRNDRIKAALKAQGVDPKADPTATLEILRREGLLK